MGVYLLNHKLPSIVLDDDYLLKAQVSFLAEYTDLTEGTRLLNQLAGRFLSDDLKIYRLRSGLSGAHVFRVQKGKDNFLLKLSREKWKLKAEADRHPIVIAGIPDFREYKAKLVPPKSQMENDGMVTRCGNWHAICFTFLGEEKFGRIIDLQEALVGIPPAKDPSNPGKPEINPKPVGVPNLDDYRQEQLKFVLDWLEREWCNAKRVQTNMVRPWDPANAPEDKYPAIPPYALTLRTKSWIMEFLESEKEIGKRLLKESWDELDKLLRSFLTRSESYGTTKLDKEIPLILSPSHGDLNANNVLLIVGFPDPVLLIDFPRYQEQGHALQDFARLETEIKYALMDRQLDTPDNTELVGFDLTPTQFQIWLELENHLQSNDWRSTMKMAVDGFPDNVNLSLQLVQSIRLTAEQVQQQVLGEATIAGFDDEYLLPLLYYTLHSITYTSLSPYKRFLAAHSAAKLLQQAGFTEQKQQAAASTKTV